jgi:hypothetical protein
MREISRKKLTLKWLISSLMSMKNTFFILPEMYIYYLDSVGQFHIITLKENALIYEKSLLKEMLMKKYNSQKYTQTQICPFYCNFYH